VHDLPDFVYFHHGIHVQKGVACVECHGRIDRMPLTWKEQPLTMEWCLECHRHPERHVRPREEVFNMGWNIEPDADHGVTANARNSLAENVAPKRLERARALLKEYKVRSPAVLTSCSTCHR
jgi:hypothetical protein